MLLNHLETIPHPSSVRGKIVFQEIGPWCQKGWGQLPRTLHLGISGFNEQLLGLNPKTSCPQADWPLYTESQAFEELRRFQLCLQLD